MESRVYKGLSQLALGRPLKRGPFLTLLYGSLKRDLIERVYVPFRVPLILAPSLESFGFRSSGFGISGGGPARTG